MPTANENSPLRIWDDRPHCRPILLKPDPSALYKQGAKIGLRWQGEELKGRIKDGLRIKSSQLFKNPYLQGEASQFWGKPWEQIKEYYRQEQELLILLIEELS